MGISDLIPGVSGGTIALLVGVYYRLIAAIDGIFSREWKKHLMFLIPLGTGVVLALLSMSRLIEWLLADYPQPTFFFFLGLIIGIIPFLLKEVDYKKTFKGKHIALLLAAAAIVASTAFIRDEEMSAVMSNLTAMDYLLLFFGGWAASSAMILPGVSGSFVFLLIGIYPTVLNAISTINIPVIIVVGAGIALGLIITSKIIKKLIRNYKIGTYAVMTGLVTGSIFVVFPGIEGSMFLFLISLVTFIAGLFCSLKLSSLGEKAKASQLKVTRAS
ncbi:DUF368 domain-containing protein [Thalassorhabdus alkalitolerans]|uniref:DUF368 domain-containing protein n=1 Tax=Thalassorhabdus alkalitolerans TaxID=2282697 RepID=A0ABW0YKH6_9BACI